MILQQFHVTEKSAPGMTALDQVMAENPVLGKAGAHRGVKCLDVVDGLADELARGLSTTINALPSSSIRFRSASSTIHCKS